MIGELIEVQGLQKSFNGVKALIDFSFSSDRGEILGFLGPNGAGKTTLFNVMSGFDSPDGGKIIFKGIDITDRKPHRIAKLGISRTFQNLRLIRQVSVLDNVLLGFRNQPGESLGNIFSRWRKCQDQETVNRREAVLLLEEAGLADKVGDSAESLSYGQQKLLSIVCCISTKAEVLLLDEPVAGLAPEMVLRILGIIKRLPTMGKSVILIEHNLDAVTQICDRAIFMDAGLKISEGTPQEVRNDPKVIESYID